MTMQLTSPAFKENEIIPKKYSGDGDDLSPPLAWTEPPPGTKSFALINDDPDAPAGTWVHWVVYDLPGHLRDLPEGVPATRELDNGARQGMTDFRRVGYGGPAPPRGTFHRYFFKLYALDAMVKLPPGATKKALLEAMAGLILAEAQLVGRYQR